MAQRQAVSPGYNALAITSMISGILGWLFFLLSVLTSLLFVFVTVVTFGLGILLYCCLIPVGCLSPIGWLVGVITGHTALGQIRMKGEEGAGMAKAGLIMGYIGLGLTIVTICVLLVLIITGSVSLMSLPFLNELYQGNYY